MADIDTDAFTSIKPVRGEPMPDPKEGALIAAAILKSMGFDAEAKSIAYAVALLARYQLEQDARCDHSFSGEQND